MRALLLSLFVAIGAFAAMAMPAALALSDKPPAGIHTSSMTAKQVLDAHAKAVGSDLQAVKSTLEEGSVIQEGLGGTYREVHLGNDYKATIANGPFTHAFGSYRGQLWRQDENGVVVLMRGVHRRDQIVDAALKGDAADPKNGIRLLGEVSSPISAYVLEVNPIGGRLEWLFYDKKTALLTRAERMYADRRAVTTYADFRIVNGVTTPWHSHTSDGRPDNDEDWKTSTLAYNTHVSESEVQVPKQSVRILDFPSASGSVLLPARIVDRHIIVRVNVNGRGLDFILDSGASGIAFDRDVLMQLGISAVGATTQTMAGAYLRTKSKIPAMDIGPLHMSNFVASGFPFSAAHGPSVRAVGLLGFDFFANLVLRIDYERGTVLAISPSIFAPPANAVPVEAALDDGVPFVPAQIGDAIGQHFILDTGASANILFSGFTQAHRNDVADEGGGLTFNAGNPFFGGRAVGGSLSLSATQVKRLRFAGTDFKDALLFKTTANRPFEGEDEDGLLGYDLLKYFTVYFDYPARRIYFVPNGLLEKPAAQR